eukprot:scaffold51787_cov30-Tisochrysis_lutea.AAC.2
MYGGRAHLFHVFDETYRVPRWVIGPVPSNEQGWAFAESDATTPIEVSRRVQGVKRLITPKPLPGREFYQSILLSNPAILLAPPLPPGRCPSSDFRPRPSSIDSFWDKVSSHWISWDGFQWQPSAAFRFLAQENEYDGLSDDEVSEGDLPADQLDATEESEAPTTRTNGDEKNSEEAVNTNDGDDVSTTMVHNGSFPIVPSLQLGDKESPVAPVNVVRVSMAEYESRHAGSRSEGGSSKGPGLRHLSAFNNIFGRKKKS